MLSTEDGPMCIAVINTSSCVMMFSTFFFEYVHEIVICFLFVMYMTKFQCLQFFFFKGGGRQHWPAWSQRSELRLDYKGSFLFYYNHAINPTLAVNFDLQILPLRE